MTQASDVLGTCVGGKQSKLHCIHLSIFLQHMDLRAICLRRRKDRAIDYLYQVKLVHIV
jgi:hypothetical protein